LDQLLTSEDGRRGARSLATGSPTSSRTLGCWSVMCPTRCSWNLNGNTRAWFRRRRYGQRSSRSRPRPNLQHDSDLAAKNPYRLL